MNIKHRADEDLAPPQDLTKTKPRPAGHGGVA